MKHMARALLCLGLVGMGLFGVETGIQYSGYVLFIGCCTAWLIL